MITGIDVSKFQGVIDWNKVVSAKIVNFAFCKATESMTVIDSQFHNNWAGIKNVGLVRGAYHFAHTGNDPIIEADNFANSLGQLDPTDMLVLDIETSDLTGLAFTNWVLAWLERVESKSGKLPIIYTGGPFFNAHDGTPDPQTMAKLSKYPLWLAAYVVNPNNYIPDEWKALGWKFWQRSGDVAAPGDTVLHLPGVGGPVDKDVFNGTLDQLKAFALNLNTAAHSSATDAFNFIADNSVKP